MCLKGVEIKCHKIEIFIELMWRYFFDIFSNFITTVFVKYNSINPIRVLLLQIMLKVFKALVPLIVTGQN